MDTQDPPTDPAINLLGSNGLDNKKDAMTSCCLDRKYDTLSGECTALDRPGRWKHRTSFSDVWRAGLRRPDKLLSIG